MNGEPVNFIIVLLLFVGIIWLQVFLSKKESKVLGLILPGLSFFYSLIMISALIVYDMSSGEVFGLIASTLLLTNVPTIIFIIIYLVLRGSIKKNKEIEKMNVYDLK